MDLIPWSRKRNDESPSPMDRFRNEVEGLFGKFFGPRNELSTGWPSWPDLGAFPRVEVTESDDKVAVRAELPGMKAEDVQIDVTGNVLTLRGEKKSERDQKQGDCCYSERYYGSFARSIQLPGAVDSEKVDATYKDGILTITLERRAESRPRRITVRSA